MNKGKLLLLGAVHVVALIRAQGGTADPNHSFSVRENKKDEFVVTQGASHATMILSVDASPVEGYAAGELQRAIHLMTGADLAILKDGASLSTDQIIIGTPATNKNIAAQAATLKLTGANDEQIAVARIGHTLYLAGNSPRAALYATYTFLQDVLGVRWLWPGESGEFIPKRTAITITDLFLSEAPALPLRSLAITGTRNGDPDTDTWMARNRMNNVSVPPGADPDDEKSRDRRKKGFLTHVSGHNIVLRDSLLRAHPDYIAELGGKREFQPGSAMQLCWSNPHVQDEVASMMAAWWDKDPYLDAIHFYPADNQRYCQCAQCKAMGDVSTRWQKFSAAVIARVEKTHPGKKYWTYAYQGYKAVPQTTPAPFAYIGYTLYDASYRHLLSSGNEYNEMPIHEMEGWLAKGAHLGIRGYEYIIFKDPMFVPSVSWVVDEMAWIKNKGLIAYASELPPYGSPRYAQPESTWWNCSRMSLYAAARAMWNTGLLADSVVRDWCNTVYGPAASPMIAYYTQMDSAWRSSDKKISLYTNSPAPEVDRFLSPRLFDQAGHYFTEARTSIASIDDAVRRSRIDEQITLESKMLFNWQKIYRFKKGIADRYKLDVVKAAANTATQVSTLPAFHTPDDQVALNGTDVSLQWTADDLLLNIICNNRSAASVKRLQHDENVLDDDAVVIFIQPDADKPSVMQLAVNAKGTTYDAISSGGYHFDTSWSPDWSATTALKKGAWTATIHIPFKALGLTARDNLQFKMSIKRTGSSSKEYSGWPDASAFNPANFAFITLVNEKTDHRDKKIILYDAGIDGGNLSVEFQQQGWEVASGVSGEKHLKEILRQDAAALLLRYDSKTWDLSDRFISKDISDYLKKGGVVVISATSDIPIEKWFDVPPVKWTGNNNTPNRRSSFVMKTGWLDHPNNLLNVLEKSLTPQSAFVPLRNGWNAVASINLKDGGSQPFLLTKQIGNGILVLTTSFTGYNGGYEMFGNRNMGNVVKLMTNLKAFQQEQIK